MTPFEFYRDLWHHKTRVPALSCGTVCLILRLAISVEHQLVTVGQTDTLAMVYTALAWHHAVKIKQLEMWANAQRDGRPAEYRWRPLFNAAKLAEDH